MGNTEFETRYRAAEELYRQGKYQEALKAFDALDQTEPNNRDVIRSRAQCLSQFGQTDEAAAVRAEGDYVRKKSHRIIGIDVARALAVITMVIVNYKNAMEAQGGVPAWLGWILDRFEGRASTTFVTLAGMGLVLLSSKARESGDSSLKWASTMRIVKRALFLTVVGALHFQIWPGDILHFYGFYMVLVALLLFAPSWTSLVGAAVVIVVTYVLHLTCDRSIGWENGWPWYNGYLTLDGFVRNTFFNGVHPVFPWTAYCMVGVWLAQRKIFDPEQRRLRLLICVPLAVVAELVVHSSLISPLPSLHRHLSEMLSCQLVAISVILVSLELADRFRDSRAIGALATTGRMALTHYLGHTVLVLGPLFVLGMLEGHTRLFSLVVACCYLAVGMTFSVLYARRYKQGPLESLMRLICG